MQRNDTQRIELLAPARDADIAIEAIKHGADAIYMGAPMFGARAAATNTIDDMARVCDFAHRYDARVYATVNTILHDHELRQAERMIGQLWLAGVDAIIVQDMGILRLDLPPIALHASTQCDVRTPQKARFLEAMGFSQLVMARELTLDEIAAMRRAVRVPLEAFVHGALCVSYSGRCQLSQAVKGRSANRGECAQMCRLPYDLLDDRGRVLASKKHLLSLRDLNRSDHLADMIRAGVSSFKIEGRLKDQSYVKNVVAYYRQAIDRVIADSPSGTLARSSSGTTQLTFDPDVTRSFNRSFTTYFIDQRRPANGLVMASIDTPKSVGQYLGRALRCTGHNLAIDTKLPITAGDGLSFIAADGQLTGVRVNAASGNQAVLRERVRIAPGTAIHRTRDKALDDCLSRPSAQRRIALDIVLRRVGDNRLALSLCDERGAAVTHAFDGVDLQPAQASQAKRQRDLLTKLGDTIYNARHVSVLPDCFVPASSLVRLRREAIDLLDRAWTIARRRPRRLPEQHDAPCWTQRLGSADNVANHLARQLYRDHGVTHIQPALETDAYDSGNTRPIEVMHTRYCLRRELGACRRDPSAHQLPDHLRLRAADGTLLAVSCDCLHCEMHLLLLSK